jgi:hypothetical protein
MLFFEVILERFTAFVCCVLGVRWAWTGEGFLQRYKEDINSYQLLCGQINYCGKIIIEKTSQPRCRPDPRGCSRTGGNSVAGTEEVQGAKR